MPALNSVNRLPKTSRRPSTAVAMGDLISEIREFFPFDAPESVLCQGPCEACTKKLLEYLDTILCDWEYRLSQGETPRLGDLHSLAKKAQKIRRALAKNAILESRI